MNNRNITRPKPISSFMAPFYDLSDIKFRPGDEWSMNVTGAAFSASSVAFKQIYDESKTASEFSETNTDSFDGPDGWTALMCAASLGRSNIVDFLLREGADPTLQNSDRRTALMLAASIGNVDSVRFIISHAEKLETLQPDVHKNLVKFLLNQSDKRGYTALHYAAYYAQKDALEALLQYGADPNKVNHRMMSPTLLACVDEIQEGCLAALLKAGGNIKLKNFDGLNGFDIANRDTVRRMYYEIFREVPPRLVANKNYGSF